MSVFPSCGSVLWYIKDTLRFWRSLPLLLYPFDAVALSLVDPPYPTPPHSFRAGTVCLELSATQRASSHGEALYRLLSSCSQRPVFHLNVLLLIFSWALKGVSVSRRRFLPSFLWLRRWGHCVQRWVGFRVQRSPPSSLSAPTRRPFHSSLPDFMRSVPCKGISSIHCVIPIDPIGSLVP